MISVLLAQISAAFVVETTETPQTVLVTGAAGAAVLKDPAEKVSAGHDGLHQRHRHLRGRCRPGLPA